MLKGKVIVGLMARFLMEVTKVIELPSRSCEVMADFLAMGIEKVGVGRF